MFEWLWLIPALPLAGFVLLAVGPPLSRRAVATVGVGSVGGSAIVAVLTAFRFMAAPPPGSAASQVIGDWMNVSGFTPHVALYLDPLAVVMTLVVTLVGFLIHLYSAAFMAMQGAPAGEGYRRFFACMNLFVASMLILVLADDLLLLYLGWEGVGLCSYLLIGFWYKDPANARAALKAFVVTRVGDALMAVALLLIFVHLGTLQIQDLMQRATEQWAPGSTVAVAVAALLLCGAVGKSAQLPLQTWLPDAMAGPTPVSALIHAATMVTAGVYLIARTHVLFELAPAVQSLVAIIGAATLLLAGFSALVQSDIKRVLAYSTISQVGYMFLALGVGAWSAAVFHFATHALFKSLLFLAAGIVIASLHEEHSMFRMGGLRRTLPLVFWTFLIGAFALASLPPATAGFSKEFILSSAWGAPGGGHWLFGAGLAGVFVTSLYTFRMLFLTFFGQSQAKPEGKTHVLMALPLILLAAACLFGGLLQWPVPLGGRPFLAAFLRGTFPNGAEGGPAHTELVLGAVSEAATIAGAFLAYLLFLRGPQVVRRLAQSTAGALIHRLWFNGWGFDWLYDQLLVQPFVFLARVNRADCVDAVYRGIAGVNVAMSRALTLTQNGQVRRYAAALTIGAVVIIAIVVLS